MGLTTLHRCPDPRWARCGWRDGACSLRGKDSLLERLGKLAFFADSYDPLEPAPEDEPVQIQGEIFQGVWETAAELRMSGELLKKGKWIRCPVVAIHGDYDPHPAEGVREPLSRVLYDFRFVLLENCGHTPWLERQARSSFFEVLQRELV